MPRAWTALLLLALPAPPPKDTDGERISRTLGERIDPEKDCRFSTTRDGLRIAIPASPHRFGRTASAGTAPRTAQTVAGDFTFEIKITQAATNPESAAADGGAGVYLWAGTQHFVTFRRSIESKKSVPIGIRTEHCIPNDGLSDRSDRDDQPNRPLYLRLERAEADIRSSYSYDGMKWRVFSHYRDKFPERVTVGVFAESGGDDAYEVEFRELKLTTLHK